MLRDTGLQDPKGGQDHKPEDSLRGPAGPLLFNAPSTPPQGGHDLRGGEKCRL